MTKRKRLEDAHETDKKETKVSILDICRVIHPQRPGERPFVVEAIARNGMDQRQGACTGHYMEKQDVESIRISFSVIPRLGVCAMDFL